MKQVLWLASWYPNSLDKFDGDFIQRQATAVALYCKVHVIYIKKDPRLKTDEEAVDITETGNLTEQIIYYNAVETGIGVIDRLLSHKKYLQHAKRAVAEYIQVNGNPDVVHVHVTMKAGILALWIKNKWGVKYIITEHWTGYFTESKPSVNDYNWYQKKLNKNILDQAALLLPVSANLGETISQQYSDTPWKVIPNVVDTTLFFLDNLKTDAFTFVHVSYMSYQKNPEGILQAAKLLKEKGYAFKLEMIGNDDAELIEMAEAYGLNNEDVQFRASVSYAEVAGYMQQAAALVLFSRFENLPCVVLEALCCGLPVISSNVGGIAEVVNESNGILVKSEDTNQLVLAMIAMIDRQDRYDEVAIAKQASAQFNYTTVGKEIFNCYNKMQHTGF